MNDLQTALKKTLNVPVIVIGKDKQQIQYKYPNCDKKHINMLDILSCKCEKRNKTV